MRDVGWSPWNCSCRMHKVHSLDVNKTTTTKEALLLTWGIPLNAQGAEHFL